MKLVQYFLMHLSVVELLISDYVTSGEFRNVICMIGAVLCDIICLMNWKTLATSKADTISQA